MLTELSIHGRNLLYYRFYIYQPILCEIYYLLVIVKAGNVLDRHHTVAYYTM